MVSPMHDGSEPRDRTRRSSRACERCRAAKMKCEVGVAEQRCRRCVAMSEPCFFPASRRGRIKGSKNLRTLERIAASKDPALNGCTPRTESPALDPWSEGNGDARIRASLEGTRGQFTSKASAAGRDRERRNNRYERLSRSGSITPWNPHSLAMDVDGRGHQTTLARKLLNILGEFPVEDGRNEDASTEPKGLQDPLWLIAGLAGRGWYLDDKHGGRKRAKPPTALSSTALPAEDARLLSKWTPEALQEIEREQTRYFEHGILGSKCDVAQDLDPVHHGLVAEERVEELFDAYWKMIHPQWAILDPSLHTPARVRACSALLTTTILALGSTALSTLPSREDEQVAEALRLHAHVEKLSLVVYATGARSIDIIQAQILLCRWGASPKTRLDEQRWMRAAAIPRMASEIGLDVPRSYGGNGEHDAEEADGLRLNDLRTRAFMIINEYRFFTYSGRQPMDLSQFELNDAETKSIQTLHGDDFAVSVPALYHLLLFDRDIRRRLDQHQAGTRTNLYLDAELEHIKSYIEGWIQEWCPKDADPTLNWHLTHDAISCWLLLAIRVARVRLHSTRTPDRHHRQQQREQQQQHLLLSLSIRLFEESLEFPTAMATTQRAAVFPFAASIVLKLSSRRDLVLRAALRMAGEPGRPYVPTFVREAGNQMLVMLCTNSLRPAPTSQYDDKGQEAAVGDTYDTSEQRRQGGGLATEGCLGNHMPTEPSGPQDDGYCPPAASNIFAFAVPDFPYIPDPSQPRAQPQDYPPLGCPPSDLEALIGTTMDYTGINRHAQPQEFPSGPVNHPPLDPAFGCLMDPLAASPGYTHVSRDGSSWGMGGLSPANTAFTGGDCGPLGDERSAQRETLLGAVGRLLQLASLM